MSALLSAIAGPSRVTAIRSPATSLSTMTTARFRTIKTLSLSSLRNPLLTTTAHVSTPITPASTYLRAFSTSALAMDKLKSHSGTKKRFFRTASGLFKRAQAGKQHLNTLFSAQRINRLGKTAYTTRTQSKMLRKLLPYA